MKYFIGFAVTVFLIFFAAILLFGGGGSKQKTPTTSKTLISYANTDAVVRMTIDGQVSANQTHQQVRVTVGKDSAVYEQINGYEGSVANMQTFNNNVNSYETFLQSLDRAGFNRGRTTKLLEDDRGFCALGNRYIYELIQDGKTLQRFWITSCSKSPKTYLGNQQLTLQLFQLQIPGYTQLASGVTGIN